MSQNEYEVKKTSFLQDLFSDGDAWDERMKKLDDKIAANKAESARLDQELIDEQKELDRLYDEAALLDIDLEDNEEPEATKLGFWGWTALIVFFAWIWHILLG